MKRTMTPLASTGLLCCLLFPVAPARAGAPFFCDATGSYYEIVVGQERINWSDSRAQAEQRTFMRRQGRLATFTSAAETACVTDRLYPPDLDLNIGGLQDTSAGEPDGGWMWITGEDPGLSYSNWCPGEPNDTNGEHFMEFWRFPTPDRKGCWNDIGDDNPGSGYVVEFPPGAVMHSVGAASRYEIVAGSHPKEVLLSIVLEDLPLGSDGLARSFDVCFDYDVAAEEPVDRGRVNLRIERRGGNASTQRIGRLTQRIRDGRAFLCKTREVPLEVGDHLTFRFTFKRIQGAESFGVGAFLYRAGEAPEQPD